ncbi:MAG: hypothetical protein AAF899_06230, partial [Pseudomonadota bacterium]
MLLKRTIAQLDLGTLSPERAREMGELGYLQWLGALPASSNYLHEAMYAYTLAAPAARRSNAVAVFCDLLIATTTTPVEPLAMMMA